MKILQINTVCGIRSTGRICTDIADVLEEKQYECKIAFGREAVPSQYEKYAVRIGNRINTYLDVLTTRIFDNAGFNSKGATKRFINWVKEYDPDVIHLHNLHGYYINIELLFDYLKTSGKPVIWTLHDCWSFTGHCTHFDYIGCEKWKTEGCSNCPLKKQYPKAIVFENSKNNYEKKKRIFTGVPEMTIVTPSKWLGDLVKQSFLKEYPVKVINNGIDLNIFKPTESGFRQEHKLENKKIVLGVASTWSKRKGLYDFVKLSELLNDDYKIVLVGLNKEQMKKMPSDILCIERTNSTRELAEIYTAADVLVNPTYEDNYPTVNLEAQACGTPVITYKTGGSPESVSENAIVPKGDINKLTEKIESLFDLKINSMANKQDMYLEYINIYEYEGKHDENFIFN
ncbi:MAG: glycosyltransferase [Ruminococcaceae bacterium]|nr:glycosyltransferase [Oscillospiraceae bacterium]